MTRIGIIVGSTRPNRVSEHVAKWVYEIGSRRHDATFDLIDLRDFPLPHLDEPFMPFDRCLPARCEAFAFRSTHDGAELVEY